MLHRKKKRGGKREGAGAKKQEPKKAIGKRVPVRLHTYLVKYVEDELQRLLDSEKNDGGHLR